jgi:hypothetical protein
MSFTDLIAAHRQLTAGLRHDGSRRAWGLAWPGDEPWHGLGDSPAMAPPPGGVLIGLLEELSAWGVRVRGMTITRLQGTLMLADGRAVVCRRGWLSWPAGRGRPLHAVHGACDPAGAARRLAQSVLPAGQDDDAAPEMTVDDATCRPGRGEHGLPPRVRPAWLPSSTAPARPQGRL